MFRERTVDLAIGVAFFFAFRSSLESLQMRPLVDMMANAPVMHGEAAPKVDDSKPPSWPSDPLKVLFGEWDAFVSEVKATNGTSTSEADQDQGPLRRRVLTNVLKRTCKSEEGRMAVTATTHLGMSKLYRMLLQARRWNGPMSAAFYVTKPHDIEKLFEFWDYFANSTSPLCHVSVHVVMEYVDPKTSSLSVDSFGYPHNTLREVALRNIDSDYFATLDVDFMTLQDGHSLVQKALQEQDGFARSRARYNQTLFIMPAFDFAIDDSSRLPSTRKNAIDLVAPDFQSTTFEKIRKNQIENGNGNTGLLYPFHMDVFTVGHGPTNFPKWLSLDDTNPADSFYPIKYGHEMEPYVIGFLDRDNIQHYHEKFRGFGYDKVSWLMHMHCHGYKFAVLRDMIVMHVYHPSTSNQFKKPFKIKMTQEYDDFRAGLKRTYPECKQ